MSVMNFATAARSGASALVIAAGVVGSLESGIADRNIRMHGLLSMGPRSIL
jgi:hypothetical protein